MWTDKQKLSEMSNQIKSNQRFMIQLIFSLVSHQIYITLIYDELTDQQH